VRFRFRFGAVLVFGIEFSRLEDGLVRHAGGKFLLRHKPTILAHAPNHLWGWRVFGGRDTPPYQPPLQTASPEFSYPCGLSCPKMESGFPRDSSVLRFAAAITWSAGRLAMHSRESAMRDKS